MEKNSNNFINSFNHCSVAQTNNKFIRIFMVIDNDDVLAQTKVLRDFRKQTFQLKLHNVLIKVYFNRSHVKGNNQ